MVATDKSVDGLDRYYYKDLYDHKYYKNEILTNLPKNVIVVNSDPEYKKSEEIQKNDLIIFLVGPTNHDAICSQWRIQLIYNVAIKILKDFFERYPDQRFLFINPQYADVPSRLKEGVFGGHGEEQILWENYYLQSANLVLEFFDCRLVNPDGDRGNVGFTVRDEDGSVMTRVEEGKLELMAFIPEDKPYEAKDDKGNPLKDAKGKPIVSRPIGTDWHIVHAKLNATRKLKEQFYKDLDIKDIYKMLSSEKGLKEISKLTNMSIPAILGYSQKIDEWYGECAKKVEEVFNKTFKV